jgi:hypothetical protein
MSASEGRQSGPDVGEGDLALDIRDCGHGIHAIDTGFVRPLFDASHLIVEAGRAAFVDVGTNDSVPRLLAALDVLGLEREAVDWVILTHVHLDNAGGAGELMRHLPSARLVVHPRGARHMIDPRQLFAGVAAVYGEEVARRDYGELRRSCVVRLRASCWSCRTALRFLDTPAMRATTSASGTGLRVILHGRHLRLCYPDLAAPAVIRDADDDPGGSIPGAGASVDRLLGFEPWPLLTHYSRVTDVERLWRVARAGRCQRQGGARRRRRVRPPRAPGGGRAAQTNRARHELPADRVRSCLPRPRVERPGPRSGWSHDRQAEPPAPHSTKLSVKKPRAC